MSGSRQQTLKPLELSKDGDDRLTIRWSDGHRSVYTWQHLRQECPCAGCREERQAPPNPLRILKPAELQPLRPVAIAAVGYYAYKITWSDGHDTGLYTLEHLRALCECPECLARPGAEWYSPSRGDPMQPPQGPSPKIAMPGVKHIVAVASGKGGVGKSTVAANLALALQAGGRRVGLLDADIYGPSVPIMMGIHEVYDPNTTAWPLERYGLKLMSMGFWVEPQKAVIWRGPMVHKYLTVFLTQVNWGELDYLVVDLPPGTGDAQLTMTQTVPLSGAVIVTTPQDVSLIDARKGLEMFRQVLVPVLGIVENMSYFATPDGQRYEIFGHGGGQKLAREAEVPFLGEIPIDPRVAECGDAGEPIVRKYPDALVSKAYLSLAGTVAEQLARTGPQQELPGLKL